MVKDSRPLPILQPGDHGLMVGQVAGEAILVGGDITTTASPGLEVCFIARILTMMPIIWLIFLESTATDLNILKILILFYVF